MNTGGSEHMKLRTDEVSSGCTASRRDEKESVRPFEKIGSVKPKQHIDLTNVIEPNRKWSSSNATGPVQAKL